MDVLMRPRVIVMVAAYIVAAITTMTGAFPCKSVVDLEGVTGLEARVLILPFEPINE